MLLSELTESIAEKAVSDLRQRTPRAKQRLLSAREVADFFESVRESVAAAACADDVAGDAVMYGGFVPNCYRGAAESDTARITLARGEDGSWHAAFTMARERAQSRSNGRGAEVVVRLRRAGQTRGRVVV